MSSTEASTPESLNSANRRNIPWNGDGVDGGPSSLDILYEWILKPGNYARWKGINGDSKEDICQEICLLMAQKGIPHRISRDIRNRITYIEKQYKEAKEYLAEYEKNTKKPATSGQGYPSNQPMPNLHSAGPSNQPMYGYNSNLAGASNQNYNNAGPSTSAGPSNQNNSTRPSNDNNNNSNSAETANEATQDPMEIASDTQSVASSVDNFDPAESLLAEFSEEPEPETTTSIEPEDSEEQSRKEIYAALAMKFKTKPIMTLDEMIEIAQAVRTAAESWKSLGYSDAEVMNKVVENWKK